MRAPLPLVSCLFGIAVLSQAVVAGDAEGCRDLKLWPRVEGCVIVECAAKQHDTTSIQNSDGPALDLATNSITYTCPAPIDPKRIEREVDLLLHKSAYQTVSEDKSHPASIGVTARKGGKWVRWNTSSEDGVSTYSVVTGDSGTERLKVEACNDSILSLPAHCVVIECTSKSEDAVEIRTNQEEQFSLEGPLLTATLACPSSSAAQIFASAQKELKESGFDILFTDHEHPESSWLTARSGKRWVELVGASDGESTSYALTVVPSAEAVVPLKPSSTAPESSESSPKINAIPAGESVKFGSAAQASADNTDMASMLAPLQAELPKQAQPVPAPRAETFKETASPPIVSSSEPSLTASTPAPNLVAPATAGAELIPPKPILQVPMEVSHDLKWSIVGRVVISMLVDVNEEGVVTKAIVTGKVTRDVEKLQSAAVNTIYRWRFEPAHKGDQRVPAKTRVQIRFEGLPRLY
jgi:TonB family protein